MSRRESPHHVSVLVVDDHVDTLHLYWQILVDAGYSVEMASSGHEGVRLARRYKPPVILMDLSMPGNMDGWDAAQTLKSAPATRDSCIIAVTARTERQDVARAYAAGCAAVVPKPVDPAALLRAVDKGIREGSRTRQ